MLGVQAVDYLDKQPLLRGVLAGEVLLLQVLVNCGLLLIILIGLVVDDEVVVLDPVASVRVPRAVSRDRNDVVLH